MWLWASPDCCKPFVCFVNILRTLGKSNCICGHASLPWKVQQERVEAECSNSHCPTLEKRPNTISSITIHSNASYYYWWIICKICDIFIMYVYMWLFICLVTFMRANARTRSGLTHFIDNAETGCIKRMTGKIPEYWWPLPPGGAGVLHSLTWWYVL